ncbi:hypothetical protein HF888_04725 [Bermanella marisrubri]|uniref:Uncharacterized protein n=1 Tax=Bermanella marisrubri TaxID=207949 RepID=Q1N1E9_9GAMM|nr:hypothetical protein [Bermanella marisrubri]EAT12101.1 hypothetical protein RED65_03645 [Oceanobacter sp. RED65] [Bermanella marisrubri]QIZ83566.1 hypothetical protein HF888_04725 [Bermanella marisrubri]
MITYLYWIGALALAVLSLYALGYRLKAWKGAAATSISILLVATLAYFFHFQQIFVKHWGGVMSVSVPEGQKHIAATWKDDHLWIENYDPKTNTCIFKEYARGATLEGKVLIKNCNPIKAN